MKQTFFIAIILLSFLSSCSSENDNNDDSSVADYFPLETGKFWVYDVTSETFSRRDSLYIVGDTVVAGESYKKTTTKELPFGFFSGALYNNAVRKSGDKILVSGSTGVNLIEGFPINLEIIDFAIFKENASNNQQIGTTSGIIEETFEGYPLKAEYTLKSIFQESLASYNVPNYGNYEDVKVIKVILNLKITTSVNIGDFEVEVPVLNSQDVLISNLYFAKGIGLIYAGTAINYELQNFSEFDITIPIPESGNQSVHEFLGAHN